MAIAMAKYPFLLYFTTKNSFRNGNQPHSCILPIAVATAILN
jgi:hypothetical protein